MTSLGWSAAFALAVVLFTGVFVSCDRQAPRRQDVADAEVPREAGRPLKMDCQDVGGDWVIGEIERCENEEAVCYVTASRGSIVCSGKGRRFTFHDDPD